MCIERKERFMLTLLVSSFESIAVGIGALLVGIASIVQARRNKR
jgi:uncharacterized membrane protein HdeD (DUF308 family)